MANHTTAAQRANKRYDEIWEHAKKQDLFDKNGMRKEPKKTK